MYVHYNQWLIGVVAPTDGNDAAVAGGVAGGILVALLVIFLLIIIILLVVLRKRKGELTNSLVQKLISCFLRDCEA